MPVPVRLRLWCLLGGAALPVAALGAQAPLVRVDPRIELTTAVFRLIGAPEYSQCRLPGYAADLDRHFAPYREHPVLKLATRLREQKGIGFDAVPFLAIALTDPPALAERVAVGANGAGIGDARWAGPHARAFITALRQFAEDSRFADFFSAHRVLYDSTEQRLRAFIADGVRLAWFDDFFGEPPSARLLVVPGMCNGGASYGPRLQPREGAEERYAILGMWQADSSGFPVMPQAALPTVIHEFNHSFVNPIVERQRDRFRVGGERLFADTAVRRMMTRQAYGEWETVIKESLVRAAVARYQRAVRGDSAAEQQLVREYGLGFLWIRSLDSSLARFEQDRGRYPRLADYAGHLAAVFEAAAPGLPMALARYEAARPRIVETRPRDGASEVDAADTVIMIRFSRPMSRGASIGTGPLGGAAAPHVRSAFWDSTRTLLTLRVTLQPGTRYQLRLDGTGFQGASGVPLAERLVSFRTRRRRVRASLPRSRPPSLRSC